MPQSPSDAEVLWQFVMAYTSAVCFQVLFSAAQFSVLMWHFCGAVPGGRAQQVFLMTCGTVSTPSQLRPWLAIVAAAASVFMRWFCTQNHDVDGTGDKRDVVSDNPNVQVNDAFVYFRGAFYSCYYITLHSTSRTSAQFVHTGRNAQYL